MIKVGVFWVAAFFGMDIIFDVEEYPDDYQSEDRLLTYSKKHKDVWGRLSKEQCGDKYGIYKFDTLPRGRVCYDLENQSYLILFNRGSKEFIDIIAPQIKELFSISNAKISINNIK